MLAVPRLRSPVLVHLQPTTESPHRGREAQVQSEGSRMEGKIDVTGKNSKVWDSEMPGTELGGTSPGQNIQGIV